MPRFTPFRIVFSFFAGYICLLGVWLALPSPRALTSNNADFYHGSVLRSGSVLTTVEKNMWLRPYQLRVDQSTRRDAFAIDWQLVANCKHDSIHLHLNGDKTIDLTAVASWETEAPPAREIELLVKIGDDDGVNPPWFKYADAVLLFWDIKREIMGLKVEYSSPAPGTVQIGPDVKPLATISGIPIQNNKCDFGQLQISDMSEFVPTKTYLVRHYILLVLDPLTTTIIAIAGPLSIICFTIAYIATVLLVVYCITALVFYAICRINLFNLGPNWRGMGGLNHGFRRPAKRSIWGATGPLTDMEPDDANFSSAGYGGPMPLTSISSFFTSKSPLDDLLATFESTRWMIRPLGRTPRQQHYRDFDVENIVPAPSKAKITINSRG